MTGFEAATVNLCESAKEIKNWEVKSAKDNQNLAEAC